VPPELGDLTQLKESSLTGNQLTGTIAPRTMPETGAVQVPGLAWMLMAGGGALLLIGSVLRVCAPQAGLTPAASKAENEAATAKQAGLG
jgi:hypothetical protein